MRDGLVGLKMKDCAWYCSDIVWRRNCEDSLKHMTKGDKSLSFMVNILQQLEGFHELVLFS